jgi:hypothetical protein
MTATATLTASPTKLRDGTWGARVTGPAAEGDTITITTRAGKSWDAEVERVLWTGDGVSICATASIDRPAHRSSRPSGGQCDNCLEYRRNLRPAADSSGIGGMVCSQCDGPSYMLSFA